ncbi:MAG: helix-turn-helix domain-containing protein [Loktanella sp.]|nr:helix-turn-helix domain-containing protein [Loktanella sp.]
MRRQNLNSANITTPQCGSEQVSQDKAKTDRETAKANATDPPIEKAAAGGTSGGFQNFAKVDRLEAESTPTGPACHPQNAQICDILCKNTELTFAALHVEGISPASRLVLFCLADHCPADRASCTVSIKRLARDARLGKTTVIRHLGHLQAAGLVTRTRRETFAGSYVANGYTLHLPTLSQSIEGGRA